MCRQYYLDSMEAVMSDQGYDARLSYYLLEGILEAARNDYNLSLMDWLEIEGQCSFNQRTLIRLNHGLTPVIVRRCDI